MGRCNSLYGRCWFSTYGTPGVVLTHCAHGCGRRNPRYLQWHRGEDYGTYVLTDADGCRWLRLARRYTQHADGEWSFPMWAFADMDKPFHSRGLDTYEYLRNAKAEGLDHTWLWLEQDSD